jgi:hypothetical protein
LFARVAPLVAVVSFPLDYCNETHIGIALNNGTDGTLKQSESGQVFGAKAERKGHAQVITIINNNVVGECQEQEYEQEQWYKWSH